MSSPVIWPNVDKKTYRLSAAANQTLDDIFNYTYNQWGEDQAKSYLGEFFLLFAAIADGRKNGRLIQPEYGVSGYFIRCGKHFIYWKVLEDGTIAIAEILHERMNIGDHLTASAELKLS